MKYRYEYMPNDAYVCIHVRIRLTEHTYVSKSCASTYRDETREQEIINILSGADGVTEIALKPYEISVQVAGAFSRKEVADNVLAILKMWCEMQGLTGCNDQWEALPLLRSDIRHMQCPECEREQERAMRDLMRDLESIDRDSGFYGDNEG